MELVIGIGLGLVLGMYFSSQIMKDIDKGIQNQKLKDNMEFTDNPDKFIPYIKGDWCDRCQYHKTEEEEHICYSCCGDDISDEDIQLCPTCKEHV